MTYRRVLVVMLAAGVFVACKRKGDVGDRCDPEATCLDGLVCQDGRCTPGPTLSKRMAEQSGVPVPTEQPAATTEKGAVRVRSAAGKDIAIAMCANDERLVGGWCDPTGAGGDSAKLVSHGIHGHTENDTIGAQWTCRMHGDDDFDLRAYALCQRVP